MKNREKAEVIIKKEGVCLFGANISRGFHSVNLLSTDYSTDVVEITQWEETEQCFKSEYLSKKRIDALIDTSTEYIVAFILVEERYHNDGLYEKFSYVHNDEEHKIRMLLEEEIRKAITS